MQTTGLAIVVGVLVLLTGGCRRQPAYEPVGDLMQIMKGIVEPSSNAVFNVGANAPTNDKEWATVEGNALMLAESGNLMLLGGRAENREADWTEQSRELIHAGKLAIQAARDKDVDRILEVGEQIYNTCVTCHKHYLPNGGQ